MNTTLDAVSLNVHAMAWLTLCLDAALKGVAVLAVAALIAAALRRSSASARHMVWLLAMMALLGLPVLSGVLPSLQVPVPSQWIDALTGAVERAPVQPPDSGLPSDADQTPAQAFVLPADSSSSEASSRDAAAMAALPSVSEVQGMPDVTQSRQPTRADSVAAAAQSWILALPLAWGAGAILTLVPLLIGSLQVWRLVRDARPVNGGPPAALLRDACRRLGLGRSVHLREIARDAIPLTCGVVRPAILLPEAARQWPADRCRAVLLHELAHVKRLDCLTQMLARLICAIYWFNPLVWVAARQLRIERERACDDMVLTSGSDAGEYAEHLLEIVRSLRNLRCPTLAALAMAQRSRFEGRLLEILDPTRNRRTLTRVALAAMIAIVAAVALPLASLRLTAAPDAPEEPVAAEIVANAGEAEDAAASSQSPPDNTVSYSGIVTDAESKPVAGVQVRLDIHWGGSRIHAKGVTQTATNSDGRFSLAAVPILTDKDLYYVIFFEHPRYALAWYQSAYHRGEDPGAVEVTMVAPTRVAGTVMDGDGNPVRGAMVTGHVQFRQGNQYDYLAFCRENGLGAVTDEQGQFALERLPEGSRLHLMVEAEGYTTYSTYVGYQGNDHPVRAGTEGITMTLEPGSGITGRLLVDGQPYTKPDITVRTTKGPEGRMGYAVTDDEGHFRIVGLGSGSYRLAADPGSLPKGLVCPLSDADVEVTAGQPFTQVDLRLVRGVRVCGRVVAKNTGRPLGDHQVVAKQKGEYVNFTTTDKEGRWEFYLPLGKSEVGTRGMQDGRSVEEVREVTVAEGSELKPIDFEVPWKLLLTGRLVDAQGRGVPGSIHFYNEIVQTGDDGSFSFDEPLHNAADTFMLIKAFDRPKQLGCMRRVEYARFGEPLEFVLQPLVTITGKAILENGSPAVGMEAGLSVGPFADGIYRGTPWKAATGSDGVFAVEDIPVGLPIHLTVRNPDYYVDRELGELDPGCTILDVGTLTLRKVSPYPEGTRWDAVVTGLVVDENGNPLVGANVYMHKAGGAAEDTAGLDGRFKLEGMPRVEKMTLSAQARGYQWNQFKVRPDSKDNRLQLLPLCWKMWGKPAPELRVGKWFNSDPLRLADLRGKVVLLHIGACFPTKWGGTYAQYADWLRTPWEKYRDKGLVAIAVHVNPANYDVPEMSDEEIKAYLARHRIDFPVAFDLPRDTLTTEARRDVNVRGTTWGLYGVTTPPTMVAIDKQGRIRRTLTYDNVDEWVTRLLAEPAPGPEPEPAADAEAWRKRFNEVYRLEDGQVLKRIAPPFIPERAEYYKAEHKFQWEAIHDPPTFFTLCWDGALQNSGLGFSSGDSHSLRDVLAKNLEMSESEFEGAEEVLSIQLPGDWILRLETPLADYLKALEKIASKETGHTIRIESRQVERDVIVAEGKYGHRPLEDSPEAARFDVYMYSDTIEPERGGGGGSGTVARLLHALDQQTGRRVIDNTEASGDLKLSYRTYRSSYLKTKRAAEDYDRLLDLLLANISKQTSLTLRKEKRLIDVWFVVDDGPAAQPPTP
ncbi:MAG: hypothetical protein JXL80_07130 [Planctomycetes bacterium]|nr:hypothetical protein [Planctomycetota bacterium]